MRNKLGFAMQFVVLVFLPLLVIWQLNFGFNLIWMPSLLLVGVVVFGIGHALREPSE